MASKRPKEITIMFAISFCSEWFVSKWILETLLCHSPYALQIKDKDIINYNLHSILLVF